MNGKWSKMTAPQDMTKPVDTGYPEEGLIKVGLASVDTKGKVSSSRPTLFFSFWKDPCSPIPRWVGRAQQTDQLLQ